MDTLSSSLTSFTLPSTSSRDLHLLKPPTHFPPLHHLPPQHRRLVSATKPTSSTTRTTRPSPSATAHHRVTHRDAASGYAAALLDVALCTNSIEEVHRDVKRLWGMLRSKQMRKFMEDEGVEEREKGEVVKQVVHHGRFGRCLARLVEVVVAKGKSAAAVAAVLVEFQRIYDKLASAPLLYS